MPPADEMKGAAHETAKASPFALMSPPWRWNEFDSGASIPVDVMSSGQPGLSGGGFSELARAATIWATPTGLKFAAGGRDTSRCESSSGPDGRITIVYMDPCQEISNSGGILAEGGAYYTFSGGKTVGGTSFARATSGFIINNDSSTAVSFLQNSGCFASVETHELGHVLGLDHSTDTTAIMYAALSFSRCQSAPVPITADDTAGIRTIYLGTSSGSTAPGAPANLTTSSTGSTAFLAWSAPTTGGTPSTYIIEVGSTPGAANLANFSTGNTATTLSAGGVPAGSYYIRVRAANSAGTSGPSNESLLVIGGGGGCTGAPAAPTNFILTGNSGGTVSFTWTASSGSPTTYVAEAGSAPGASNLANVDLGSTATTLTATGVGPGTYYVRLRARNACGTSGVSNEVTLVVQ